MAKATIPEYFATEQMETSRLPRAPAGQLADTGQGLEAMGLAGFGKALAGLGSDVLQNIINVRSESQLLEGTSQWERAHTVFFTGLAKDQDFENYGIKYKAFAKSLRRQILQKKLTTPARRNLEGYMENQQVSKEKHLAGMFLTKQRDYGRVSAFESVIKFERAEDFDGAISAINHARDIGFMSAEEAHNRKQEVQGNIADYQKQTLLTDIHESAKTLSYAEAISYLNDIKGLTSAERNDLIRRRERQNEIETATTNRQVRWDTLTKIGKDPESITDEYLSSLVKPNSLTWDDAEELRKVRDTDNHQLKRPDFQRGITTLEEIKDMRIAMMKKEEATDVELREELLLHFGLKNDLEHWILEKDRTSKEIVEKVKSLTEPVAEEEVRGWLDYILNPLGWESGTAGTKIRGLLREKPKEGEEDLIGMTDEELEAIIRGK